MDKFQIPVVSSGLLLGSEASVIELLEAAGFVTIWVRVVAQEDAHLLASAPEQTGSTI